MSILFLSFKWKVGNAKELLAINRKEGRRGCDARWSTTRVAKGRVEKRQEPAASGGSLPPVRKEMRKNLVR